jgi:prepilin-type N-terminal cleavage/methylation domain-containing protein
MKRTAERGDTLVEVLMAMVILSMIIVGAFTMMSRGLSATQTSVEHTQVRMQLNAQSDMLRYLRDSYVNAKAIGAVSGTPAATKWSALISDPTIVNTTSINYDTTCAPQKKAFYISKQFSPDTAITYTVYNAGSIPNTYSQIRPDGVSEGLWIEAVASTNASPSYVDFVIRACWTATGIGGQQRSGTVVRLYDGR